MQLPATWSYAAHPQLKAIKERLEARFGSALQVLPSTHEWFTFQVAGMTDEVLIRTLEREQHQLFGNELGNFQAVCKMGGKEPGVSIQYLPGGALSGEPGFWYY